jgi:formylglycine-generating enzyme required for sulfatase activity
VPDFIEVPGGAFSMGADRAADRDAFDNERWPSPSGQGSVDVPMFYISRREVSITQFAAFAQASGWRSEPRAIAGAAADPVTFVTWPDALAYCRWLQAALPRDAATPAALKQRLAEGWRVTLPDEAEWEKAARLLDASQFSWGRVSEWTRSPYQPYPYDPRDDRANLEADALWVIRGGVLDDRSARPRATARTGADPGARRAFIGFRVAIVEFTGRSGSSGRADGKQTP